MPERSCRRRPPLNAASLYPELVALAQVVFIDVVLAGDNAVVVGMAAAGVHPSIRAKVIFFGIAGAVALRIVFALIATQILAIVGLTLAGGVLLLWVGWKMYREMTAEEDAPALATAGESAGFAVDAGTSKTFGQAMTQIIVADLSMSIDNVLAVAGAAKDHLWVMVAGLVLSVGLMGAAATLIAKVLHRFRWIAWAGLGVILYVALSMIWRGTHQVACAGLSPDMCRLGVLDYMTHAAAHF
ncbi:TerC family protein [Methyloraptor flagellatus]|uniref:TerC family protein n=1 Tax=Methyloraptor flagellatus TaxID=3162530 RepID=A0AAU7X8D7_9HYPH